MKELIAGDEQLSQVIHVAKTAGLEIFSDIVTQTLLCR
jgi:hypothetical protein